MITIARQTGTIITIGLSILLTACAVSRTGLNGDPPPVDTIRNVSINDSETGTEILVQSDQPIRYTTYVNTTPPKFIVDLAGMDPGEYAKSQNVGKGSISQLDVAGVDGSGHLVRVEVGLTEVVDVKTRAEGNMLFIDVPHPAYAMAPLVDARTNAYASDNSVPTSAENEGKRASSIADNTPSVNFVSPATILSSVKVWKDSESVRVTVAGDGSLNPDVTLVGRDRLVLDFVGTMSLIGKKTVSVDHNLLRGVRIGQHREPKKVRVVLDLSHGPVYDITTEKNQVVVMLSPGKDTEVSSPSVTGLSAQMLPPVSAVPVDSGVNPKENDSSAVVPMKSSEEGSEDVPAKVSPGVTGETSKKTVSSDVNHKTFVSRKSYTGRKISLDFQDADVTNVLRLIADVSGLNVVVSDDVKGSVTLKLVNVPWDQALDIILKMNNLGQVREGNILRVATLSNITRQADEEAKAFETRLRALPLETRVVYVNYAKAKELAEPLKKSLSARGEITIDDRTNALIVKDVDEKIRDIQELVQRLDSPTPQVQIEARIVEVNPTFTQSLGIQWGGTSTVTRGPNIVGINGGNTGAVTAPTPDFAVNLPAAPLFGAFGITWGQFTKNPFQLDLRLSAGVSTGMTKIISTPKITVLDNQEAKIEQGATIPYATSSPTGGTNTTFIDANLTLLVTPHVTRDGSIIMKVKATNNEPGEVIAQASGPTIRKKEASTNVLVKDGETTVIGGIYKTKKVRSMSGVPYLSSIPGLGWLFKTTIENDEVSELLVFLTPKIVQ